MRAFAFAYCNAINERKETYRALIEGLVKNLKEVALAHIIFVTDDNEPCFVGGVHCLRVTKQQPLMTWRLKAHQMAHSLADEILFLEPDVRLSENPLGLFDDQDFDIAITPRISGSKLFYGEDFTARAPYTLGCTFSRSEEFWRQAKLHCQTLPEAEQQWMGDMYSVSAVAKDFKVKLLDAREYNRVPDDPDDTAGAKSLHYGGKRKQWLFQQVVEA